MRHGLMPLMLPAEGTQLHRKAAEYASVVLRNQLGFTVDRLVSIGGSLAIYLNHPGRKHQLKLHVEHVFGLS